MDFVTESHVLPVRIDLLFAKSIKLIGIPEHLEKNQDIGWISLLQEIIVHYYFLFLAISTNLKIEFKKCSQRHPL